MYLALYATVWQCLNKFIPVGLWDLHSVWCLYDVQWSKNIFAMTRCSGQSISSSSPPRSVSTTGRRLRSSEGLRFASGQGRSTPRTGSDWSPKVKMASFADPWFVYSIPCLFGVIMYYHSLLFISVFIIHFINVFFISLKPMDSFGMWWNSNEIIFLHWIIIL